jgi:hexosaminidase
MQTDESYELSISDPENIEVNITAKSFYGARHGLETLSQLIVYDDINNQLKCLSSIQISDGPKFKHRGISFDTSRTFFSVDSIKRLIDTMAMVKMNVFHWHITDCQSFPIYIKSHPELTKYGAYSKKKVYTPDNVRELVEYGKIRGLRIIPELDMPAHVIFSNNHSVVVINNIFFTLLTRLVKVGKHFRTRV